MIKLYLIIFSLLFSPFSEEKSAQKAYEYFLEEVELDPELTHEEQLRKVDEFQNFSKELSTEEAKIVVKLLLAESRRRVIDIFQKADLNQNEFNQHLADFDKAVSSVKNLDVETARQMLFFIAELKIHRQFVFDFGVALGCPEKQLLRHDLCKLKPEQLEGYARYFRGGRKEEDKLAYLAAWDCHQHAEHHHECYSKEGFNFDTFPEEKLRYNMLEAVADLLAATKQRGGCTLISWLTHVFPKKNPHPRLIPYLEEALIKAHSFYLENAKDPSCASLFKGLPCWNSEIALLFESLK